jgi:hypothetical protein
MMLDAVNIAAFALDRKKLAAFSALGGGFLRFPIGDRRCNRTRPSDFEFYAAKAASANGVHAYLLVRGECDAIDPELT